MSLAKNYTMANIEIAAITGSFLAAIVLEQIISGLIGSKRNSDGTDENYINNGHYFTVQSAKEIYSRLIADVDVDFPEQNLITYNKVRRSLKALLDNGIIFDNRKFESRNRSTCASLSPEWAKRLGHDFTVANAETTAPVAVSEAPAPAPVNPFDLADEKHREFCERYHGALDRAGKLKTRVNFATKKWADSIRLLEKEVIVPDGYADAWEYVVDVATAYFDSIDDEFSIEAYSLPSFRTKFPRIVSSLDRKLAQAAKRRLA